MKRTPRKHKQRIKALTDPRPEFVSLVRAGANMTPFLVVKSDEPISEEVDMNTALKADTHDIVRITFKADKFADEAAVTAWLTAGGYDGFTVAKTDTGFEVVSAKADAAEGVEQIELADEGVTVHVAEKDADEDADEDGQTDAADDTAKDDAARAADTGAAVQEVQPVAKDAEASPVRRAADALRAKYDGYLAAISKGKTLQEVLTDGASDGIPVGMYEVVGAMYSAVRNNIVAGDREGIKAVAGEFGEMVVALLDVLPMSGAEKADLLAPEITIAPAAKQAPAGQDDAPAAAGSTDAAKGGDMDADDQDKKGGKKPKTKEFMPCDGCKSPAKCQAAAKCMAKKDDADAADQAAPVPAAKAEDGLAEQIGSRIDAVAKSVEALAGIVSTLTETVKVKTEEVASRVEALENGRQSRKGADVDDVASGSQTARSKASEEVSRMALHGILGIQRRRS